MLGLPFGSLWHFYFSELSYIRLSYMHTRFSHTYTHTHTHTHTHTSTHTHAHTHVSMQQRSHYTHACINAHTTLHTHYSKFFIMPWTCFDADKVNYSNCYYYSCVLCSAGKSQVKSYSVTKPNYGSDFSR